ncbi:MULTISPECIES: DUF4177 domain-containing protein [Kyrpidia]|uniref:Uncharacterized protein n=2 Tax=Kyrpidia spormannii TaxID=2055160 RepID=A0ACA8Z9Z6_9BACL|nr:DUF4177 domain-containing protein [Kyrpidia spormannii]MCL6574782.1 DUF4177 domain-containing protein [Kyrpidia sp.]CAB3392564.1 conserved protein of unknown function [Kyrpidia spormannii]CAB3393484.1 conserved protein of unknown function [Kyrpidia spormannii]
MARIQWEYTSLVNHVEGIRNQLNNMGQQGWELVSIVPIPGQFHCTAVFKRPGAPRITSVKKRGDGKTR